MVYYCPVCVGKDFDYLDDKPAIKDFVLEKKRLDVYNCKWCGVDWLIHKL